MTQVSPGLLPAGGGTAESRQNCEQSKVLGHRSTADVRIGRSHGISPAVLSCCQPDVLLPHSGEGGDLC